MNNVDDFEEKVKEMYLEIFGKTFDPYESAFFEEFISHVYARHSDKLASNDQLKEST